MPSHMSKECWKSGATSDSLIDMLYTVPGPEKEPTKYSHKKKKCKKEVEDKRCERLGLGGRKGRTDEGE